MKHVLSSLMIILPLNTAMAAKLDPSSNEYQRVSNDVDALVSELFTKENLPGIYTRVTLDGTTIFEKSMGYANIEKKSKIDGKSSFRVGSITKMFTATSLLIARDQGKLSLDDPLMKYLPKPYVKNTFSDRTPITLRQVVSHTSGLPTEPPVDSWQTLKFPSLPDFIKVTEGITLETAPGEKMRYSNLGFALLGHAVAKRMNSSYETLIKQKILDPLGMSQSNFEADGTAPNFLVGYMPVDTNGIRNPAPRPNINALSPSGQLYSTVDDLSKFAQFHLASGAKSNTQPLGNTTLREMRAPVYVNSQWEEGVGLGWMLKKVDGRTIVGHAGGVYGYTSDLSLIPEKKLVAITVINTGANPTGLNHKILSEIASHLDLIQQREEEQLLSFRAAWKKFIGEYALEGIPPLKIFNERNRLLLSTVQTPSGQEPVFAPLNENEFLLRGEGVDNQKATFKIDSNGNVIGFGFSGYFFKKIK